MINDIRPEKAALRNAAIEWRKALSRSEKQRMDFKIQSKVMNLWKFREVRLAVEEPAVETWAEGSPPRAGRGSLP